MTTAGYYRWPTIHNNTLVFVSEDDLWTVPANGGITRRLTSNPGNISRPALSPDGSLLAFTGRDEGHAEVYAMPAPGGQARRLTFFGVGSYVIGWSLDSKKIIFSSSAGQPFRDLEYLYEVDAAGGAPQRMATGPAKSIAFGKNQGIVIGRNTSEPAHWKRYRGGQTGDLWIDKEGTGAFKRLIKITGNLADPLWIDRRIYFISDHAGIGNIYSCNLDGKNLRQHTHHKVFYARQAASDGHRIVYQAGADLYIYDPEKENTQKTDIQHFSPGVQRNRKFVYPGSYLQGYSLHPKGHSVGIISRGQAFSMANWEGAVQHHAETNSGRRRLIQWLKDGERLIMVSDVSGEEVLEIHWADGRKEPEKLEHFDIGRPHSIAVSPTNDRIVLNNDRLQLIFIDLEQKQLKILDEGKIGFIGAPCWSPDGRWIAYSYRVSLQTSIIKIYKVETGESWEITKPVRFDLSPNFDPDGNYLYFISYRNFDPVHDNMQFDLGFPLGVRPYLITLKKELPSPFLPIIRPPGEKIKDRENSNPAGNNNNNPSKTDNDKKDKAATEKKEEKLVEIDFEGIQNRIVAFPVSEGRYNQIKGIDGKVLFTYFPVETSLESTNMSGNSSHEGQLQAYDFEDQKLEVLAGDISTFNLSLDRKALIYRSGSRLRVLKAGEKTEKLTASGTTRGSGWLNLSRIKISIHPPTEWQQMYREAWRLQRDHFWTGDMGGVDWEAIYRRYLPLLGRIATRGELSDLLREMQGELGTSHAFEYGGDYRPAPHYSLGYLGADFDFDPETGSYRLVNIVQGDSWNEKQRSPLAEPGLNLKKGQRLLAINGIQVSRERSPQNLLVHQANNTVSLTFSDGGETPAQTINVKVLAAERPLRYRNWVESNRELVHKASDGQIGYIHIPNMGSAGFAEFHRGYLLELHRDALIIDIRYNSGGNVSSLLLEKLARRRIGYDFRRWGAPIPYPSESIAGPMVALINENACSDGDIFAHCFKKMKLGPLVGTRTWGGVIGIAPRFPLIDGTTTTQPEYSFWVEDIGWGLENYGAEPDIKVEIKPQQAIKGQDPQLKRGIKILLKMIGENPPLKPDVF